MLFYTLYHTSLASVYSVHSYYQFPNYVIPRISQLFWFRSSMKLWEIYCSTKGYRELSVRMVVGRETLQSLSFERIIRCGFCVDSERIHSSTEPQLSITNPIGNGLSALFLIFLLVVKLQHNGFIITIVLLTLAKLFNKKRFLL